MFVRIAACSLSLLLTGGSIFAAGADRPSANFKVSQMTAVPGKTLPPGSYTIRVLDHLSDRYILRVDSASGSSHTLFVGLPGKGLDASAKGEIAWKTPAQGAQYIRGWKFASLPPIEFAYPKNDAVAVAKANNAQVPAIDPESDNMVSAAKLSPDEMHIITLWLLTPTAVGPNSPAGISATRLTQLASARKPTGKLPHTASALPLAGLLGVFSMLLALGARTLRPGEGR